MSWNPKTGFFFKTTPLKLQREERLEAQVSLMQAQSAHEYAQSMVTYHQTRVDRLTASIIEGEEEERAALLAARKEAAEARDSKNRSLPDPQFGA